jgi:hypothetical protein
MQNFKTLRQPHLWKLAMSRKKEEERGKIEREKNAIYSGHLRLCQQPRAAHALRLDQNQPNWLWHHCKFTQLLTSIVLTFSSYFTTSPDRQMAGAGNKTANWSQLSWAGSLAELGNFQAMEVSWLEFCFSNVFFVPTKSTLRPTQHRFLGVPTSPQQSLIAPSWTRPFCLA